MLFHMRMTEIRHEELHRIYVGQLYEFSAILGKLLKNAYTTAAALDIRNKTRLYLIETLNIAVSLKFRLMNAGKC